MSTSRWGERLVRYPADLAHRYRQAGLWGTRTIADQLFARAGVERSIGIEVPDSSIHASLVRAGLGVAILPESMIESAGLAGVPLRPAATFNVAFVVVADRPPSPVTQAFADLVTATRQPGSAQPGS